MFATMIRRQIQSFETTWDYDATYLHELLDIGLKPVWVFQQATGLGSYRDGVPVGPWFAAKLVSAKREDCGPCVQLAARMAQEGGLAPAHIGAVLARRFDELPDDVALGARFTEAVLTRSPDADALREQVVASFGRRGLVSLAFAMLSARLYPDLKFALGHGHACSMVVLDEEVLWTPAMEAAG